MAIIFRDRNQPHDAGEEATWVISGTSSVMYVKGVNEFPVNSSLADTNAADVDYLRDLGHQTVRKVRELLPHGTLNNVMRRGKYPSRAQPLANFGYVTAERPGMLNSKVEKMAEKLWEQIPASATSGLRTAVQMAAVDIAARAVGGGVCAHVAHVTMGVLTTTATDVVAAIVWHNADHQFVIIARPGSRWYVIDPWVGNSYVLPLDECYFEEGGISNSWLVIINGPLPIPYGITFDDHNITQAEVFAEAKASRIPEVEHVWAHEDNRQASARGVPGKLSAGPDQWGKAT